MIGSRIGIGRSPGRPKRLAPQVLHPAVIVISALLAGCALLLAGPASAATLSPTAKPVPVMTLTASATTVLASEPPPVLTVTMPADATGEVGFYDSARPGIDKGIGLAPIVDGVATLTAPDRPLVLGANPITASYGGNAVYGPADSNTVTVTVVSKLMPTLTLTASATLLLQGHGPVLTAQLPADATGTVGFYLYHNGPCLLGSASVAGGTASITAASACLLDTGSFYVDAVYSGDARYYFTRSNVVTLTVIGPSQALAFTGTQQTVPIPLGAASVRITAAGASGASIGGCGVHTPAGGFGALVSGIATLPAGAADLVVDVGGAGSGRTGGWGGIAGGGTGGHRGGLFSGDGGGGGGATTVRLSSGGFLFPLVIAGGGGGAGDCGEFFSVGGNGGSGGLTAGNGQNGSGGISPGSGGTGGTAATPAGTGGTGAGGGGGGGAAGGEGGSGDSQGAAGGGGGAGSSAASRSLVSGVTILTATPAGNGTVTLSWMSG
jgi:hypothetical protein